MWVIEDVATPGPASRLFLLNRLTSELLLPLSALGLALYAGWVLRDVQARDELYYCNPRTFWIWRILLRYIAPPAIVAVLVFANLPQ